MDTCHFPFISFLGLHCTPCYITAVLLTLRVCVKHKMNIRRNTLEILSLARMHPTHSRLTVTAEPRRSSSQVRPCFCWRSDRYLGECEEPQAICLFIGSRGNQTKARRHSEVSDSERNRSGRSSRRKELVLLITAKRIPALPAYAAKKATTC